MSEEQYITGGASQVYADVENNRVIAKFFGPDYIDPATGETVAAEVMEVTLAPDVARDFAYTLTKASIVVEEARK